ncbi:torsin-4A isoform 1-T3 [Discoglossus pictus]
MEDNEACRADPVPPHKISLVSTPVRAVLRIKKRIRTLKGRLQLDVTGGRTLEASRSYSLGRPRSGDRTFFKSLSHEKPDIFSFDSSSVEQASLSNSRRKKKPRKSRPVLFPGNGKKYLPVEQKSKAKRCLLLLIGIISFQILNAIENLDDNVQKYDLDGLDKTLHREVFGQNFAIERIMDILKDYLATHYHNKPLVISLNGPSGVGKSHMGRILAKHFRSVMESDFVLQYYVMHNCPQDKDVVQCHEEFSTMISNMVTRAELEEKIPFFIIDEMEQMSSLLLDTLKGYFRVNQSNEYLNAVYILISNIGGNEITKFVLQNASSDIINVQVQLHNIVTSTLRQHHSIWDVAEIVPFTLLEKSHIVNCFLDELLREGFYPDNSNIENLAAQLHYYTKGGKQYSISGCKQVVAKVNLLHPYM